MKDYCLRTNTQKEMIDALLAGGIYVKTYSFYGEEIIPKLEYDVHVLGHIPIADIILGENGEVLQEATFDQRWHVNLRCHQDLTPEQISILPIIDPQPSTPKAKFA